MTWAVLLAGAGIAATIFVDLIEAMANHLARRDDINLPGWL